MFEAWNRIISIDQIKYVMLIPISVIENIWILHMFVWDWQFCLVLSTIQYAAPYFDQTEIIIDRYVQFWVDIPKPISTRHEGHKNYIGNNQFPFHKIYKSLETLFVSQKKLQRAICCTRQNTPKISI